MATSAGATTCPICGGQDWDQSNDVKDFSISGETFHLASCARCQFLITMDAPGPAEIGPYYQSDVYISHSNTKRGPKDWLYHLARQWMLKRKVRLVKKWGGSKGTLLDIGSGTGYFLKAMSSEKWSVRGVEVDDGARRLSQQKFDLDVIAEFREQDFNASSIDVITLWHVMEHVHDLDTYWSSFQHLLSHKGSLIIAVPNHESLDSKKYGKFWAAWDVPRHLWHFRSQDIVSLSERYGFEVVERCPMPLDGYYVSILSEQYQDAGILTLLKGLFNGLLCHMRSSRIEDYSSIIYILKKKSD